MSEEEFSQSLSYDKSTGVTTICLFKRSRGKVEILRLEKIPGKLAQVIVCGGAFKTCAEIHERRPKRAPARSW